MRVIRWYCLGQDGGFRGWYDSQPLEVQAKIEVVLAILEAQRTWDKTPFYESLRGKCEGLGEIKFSVGERHYRLLGFDGPGKREFTIGTWFQKRNNSDYGRECPKGRERKEGVLKDGSRAKYWPF